MEDGEEERLEEGEAPEIGEEPEDGGDTGALLHQNTVVVDIGGLG